MLDPSQLFDVTGEPPSARDLVFIHGLTGYVDAGDAVRLVTHHLLTALPSREVARFDTDQLFDYRARRPVMAFDTDHWVDYATPELVLWALTDTEGGEFLLLTGPEPDFQWERFVTAVQSLIEAYGVRLTIGINAIPMAVPHTRPIGLTRHATSPELIPGNQPWLGHVQVPGSAAHLLEFRLGRQGRDAVGLAVHVPHYVAQSEFPPAALRLVEELSSVSGLRLPRDPLAEAAANALRDVDRQVAESAEAMAMVSALEQQYDAFVRARGGDGTIPAEENLPTAEELGAELERFLAEHTRRWRGEEPDH
ncbi:MAG: PAC2 family protein [Acidothermus sp.]|nr:PAC2 family protein [Acidothermus sp.]MCL6537320.1 PAC2 family protein [Acidothermus sp.]